MRIPPLLFTLLAGCASDLPPQTEGPTAPAPTPPVTPAPPNATGLVAIVGVTVVPMDRDRTIGNRTLLIRDGVITAIGSADSTGIPPAAQIIDGRGKYIMPGLIDMHVHINYADLPLYVQAGITTVRNMWGFTVLPRYRADIANGVVIGPTIYSASQGLDGNPVKWPQTQVVEDARRADSVVVAQTRAGWNFIKVYDDLPAAVYDSIVTSARRNGTRIAGHVPARITLQHALGAGQSSIEHMTGYETFLGGRFGTNGWAEANRDRMPDAARRTAVAGVWNCPTMAIFIRILNQRFSGAALVRALENRRLMLKALHDAGAPLLLGTDAGIDIVPPGSSIHDELDAFVAAGLTPYQALRAGTADAAFWLGIDDVTGTVAVGRRADLLLLTSDPLVDVRAARNLSGVLLRGAWYPRP
jgi:hypothetical protein